MQYTYCEFLTKLRDEFTNTSRAFANDAKKYKPGQPEEQLYLDMANATSDKAWALDKIIADLPIELAEKTVGAN